MNAKFQAVGRRRSSSSNCRNSSRRRKRRRRRRRRGRRRRKRRRRRRNSSSSSSSSSSRRRRRRRSLSRARAIRPNPEYSVRTALAVAKLPMAKEENHVYAKCSTFAWRIGLPYPSIADRSGQSAEKHAPRPGGGAPDVMGTATTLEEEKIGEEAYTRTRKPTNIHGIIHTYIHIFRLHLHRHVSTWIFTVGKKGRKRL